MGEIAIHSLGFGQNFSAPLSKTVTIHTVTSQPAAPAASCIPAPTLIDPFAGKPPAVTSLTLAWKSDYALQPGEMFDVLVSPNASVGAKRRFVFPSGLPYNGFARFGIVQWTWSLGVLSFQHAYWERRRGDHGWDVAI